MIGRRLITMAEEPKTSETLTTTIDELTKTVADLKAKIEKPADPPKKEEKKGEEPEAKHITTGNQSSVSAVDKAYGRT